MRPDPDRRGIATDGQNEGREQIGFVVAIPAAAGFWLAGAFTHLAMLDGFSAAVADLPALLIGALIVGLPVAAVAVISLAGPLFALCVLIDKVHLSSALVAGAMVGIVVVSIFNRLLDGGSLLTTPMGGVVGAATAATWWAIAKPPTARR